MLDQEVLYRATPFRIDALLLGGLIALLRRGPSARAVLKVARIGFALLSSTVAVKVAYNFANHPKPAGPMYPAWTFTWGLTFVDLLAACVLVMALEYGSLTCHILNLQPLRWLGRISYGAYVFHDIIHPEFRQLTRNLPQGKPTLFATAAIALCFTLAAAWASYRWFESPFIRLKDRWTGRT
jgi:peptidoglycan/LPS O-acetylase OafA/YrhL